MALPVRISNDQTRSNYVEGCVNMHGLRVIEAQGVDIVLITKVPLHPINPKLVGYLYKYNYIYIYIYIYILYIQCKE